MAVSDQGSSTDEATDLTDMIRSPERRRSFTLL